MLYSIFDPFSLEQEDAVQKVVGSNPGNFFYLVSTLSMSFVADVSGSHLIKEPWVWPKIPQ